MFRTVLSQNCSKRSQPFPRRVLEQDRLALYGRKVTQTPCTTRYDIVTKKIACGTGLRRLYEDSAFKWLFKTCSQPFPQKPVLITFITFQILVHLDTVSRQIFGDIQEIQFSGSETEVHVPGSSSSSSLLSTLKIATRQKVGGSIVTAQI